MIEDEIIVIEQAQVDEIKWVVSLFKLIWWSLNSIIQIWPTRKKLNPSYLLHNVLYMDVIFNLYLIYYYYRWASLTLIIPFFIKFCNFQKTCEGKYKIFYNIQKYSILQISNFINYFTTCVEVAFTLH
jgi:hypothetical protein